MATLRVRATAIVDNGRAVINEHLGAATFDAAGRVGYADWLYRVVVAAGEGET